MHGNKNKSKSHIPFTARLYFESTRAGGYLTLGQMDEIRDGRSSLAEVT